MNIRPILSSVFVLCLLLADVNARKSSGRRGGWSSHSRGSRTTPRPRTSHQESKAPIGWNVPGTNSKPSSGNTAAKPSAPVNENLAKSSATNVQSSYNPSGGYPRQPASNPYQTNSNPGQGYNPSAGHGYNPSVGQGYNPAVGQGYNPAVGHGYNPSVGQGYNPAVGGHSPYGGSPVGSYHPSAGQPYNPSFGQSPMGAIPQQTVLVSSQPYKPGIGQIAKEAFVYAGVSAGVNAAVNRIIPGGIYGTRGSSEGGGGGGAGGGGSHTQITYNNYYNNGTAASPGTDQSASANAPAPAPAPAPANNAQSPPVNPPNQPPVEASQATQNNASPNGPAASNDGKSSANTQDAQQNNPNPLGYVTSNDDIKKVTESLFEKDKNNAFKYITMNLQGQKKDESTTDDASEPLLDVKSEAYEIPTVKAVLTMHDNYELDVKTKETVTPEERKEESDLLDKFLETDVMKETMKFLADKGYIPNDEYEFKDSLKRIWFSQFKRMDGDASSSGFETIFLAEQFDNDIIGLHNWIYYGKQEAEKKLNYLGYIKEVKLGDKGAVVKVRSTLNGIVQPVTTIFVGTSPELELALYTMCFYARPNNVCPVSLGGTEFVIIANRVNYFGKDIMISGYPEI